MKHIRSLIRYLLTLVSFLCVISCGGGSNVGETFVFHGQWETETLSLVYDTCTGNILKSSTDSFPIFGYSVKHENPYHTVEIVDSSGSLSGDAGMRDFLAVGEDTPVEQSLIVDSLADHMCTVHTVFDYEGDSELSGNLTLTFRFECRDAEGKLVRTCELSYSGTSNRTSDTI